MPRPPPSRHMQLQSPCADSVVTAVTSGLVAKMEAAMLPCMFRIWVAAVARSVSLAARKLRDSPLMHRFGHDTWWPKQKG
jgi:hypothetical protein